MPDIAGKREAGAFRNEMKKVEALLDVSEDGGAVAVYDMIEVQEDIVIHQAYTKVKEAATDGGATAPVEIGIKGGDTDAILPATLVASLTLNAIIDGAAASDRLRVASGSIISAEVKNEALTAGKIAVVIEYSAY